MPEPGALPERDEILRALRELQERVARLEQRLEIPQAAPRLGGAAAEPPRTALVEGALAVPILGRTLLGLAGAYGLRALSGAHALPASGGVLAAIVYALAWLVWAARTPAGRRTETVLYSLTSALVLAPLLWESTLRLRVLSTDTAAAILLLFTVFGLLISWHKNLLVVATIATLTSILTGSALLIGSHDLLPFTLLLLAIAAAVETSACLDHWLSERWVAAAAADLVVLLATYLVTDPRGLPEAYLPVSHAALLASQMILLAIYLVSILVRTLLRGFVFTGFETAQLAVACLLALGGALRLTGEPYVRPAMVAVSLLCTTSCWAAAFLLRGRNRQTYAWFGCLLTLAGTRIAMPPGVAAALWCLLALGAFSMGTALRRQGVFLLLCGVAASGALADATVFLLGSTDTGGVLLPLTGAAAVAAVCYRLSRRRDPSPWLGAILAGLAFWLAAGAGAALLTGLYHTFAGAIASHAYCATLRTAVLALGAVLLASAARFGKRSELIPLVYLVMTFAAYRLLLIDLRQEGNAALVLSLLVYGLALMQLPRLMQPRPPAAR